MDQEIETRITAIKNVFVAHGWRLHLSEAKEGIGHLDGEWEAAYVPAEGGAATRLFGPTRLDAAETALAKFTTDWPEAST